MDYAIINGDGVCVGVASLSDTVSLPEYIQIPQFDESLLGKKYENGEWLSIS